MTRQTHIRVTTLILLMTVITDARNATIIKIGKRSDKNMQNFKAKLLTTAYKSKIIRFKMDENPLQRRI